LIAASALGGDFGAGASRTAVFPGHGAIAGLVKSLAKEWPDVRCRVVDCDGSEKADLIAGSLMEELSLDDSEIEVGRRTQGRLCFQTTPAPLRGDATPQVELTSDSVILVTGGARGITAAISVELARRYRPTLYLLGRSEFPSPKESMKTSEITAIHDLKKALIEEHRVRGEAPNAAHIEATCARLLKDREMRAAVRAMEESGARVHYHPVDVSDAAAVSVLLERIYQTHGRIDGVIHGAGVIEDSLLGDKDPASYDRVFETKLFGALALVRGLRPDSLKFLVFFSSVAGLFGNRGQTDYAAANEALNQLSIALDRAWPARVVSINWGPWAEIGMVSAEIQRTFVARGVQPITPSAGQKMFALELERGSKGEVEIILGSGPWAEAPRSVGWDPDFVAEKGHEFPLLADLKIPSARSGSVDLTYVLNPDKHSYLADHLLDSRPVMPAAVVLELMAELVQRTWPNLEVAGARDFRVLNGIVLENGSMPIRITARPDRADSARRITVHIQDPTEGSKFYQATIVLSDRLEKQDYCAPSIKGRGAYPLTVSESYERLLFHGPAFQGIEEIQGFSRDSITAILLPSSPSRLLKGSAAKRWLIDPVVVDSAFQLALLWARLNSDMTVLPVRFANFRRFRPLTGSRVRCDFLAQPNNGDHTFEAKITFVDESGQLLWLVEGVEFGGTNALNRLGGRAMRGHAG
jgi:NAD(P)-dependent dehydrogenase (short-subunit alcohol dehydrogenase family)